MNLSLRRAIASACGEAHGESRSESRSESYGNTTRMKAPRSKARRPHALGIEHSTVALVRHQQMSMPLRREILFILLLAAAC